MLNNCLGLHNMLCLKGGIRNVQCQCLEIRRELGGNPFKGIDGSLKFDSE